MTTAMNDELVSNADSLLIVHVQQPREALAHVLELRPQLANAVLYAGIDDATPWESSWPDAVWRIHGMQLFALITPPSNFCIGLSPPVLDAAQCAVLFPATSEDHP